MDKLLCWRLSRDPSSWSNRHFCHLHENWACWETEVGLAETWSKGAHVELILVPLFPKVRGLCHTHHFPPVSEGKRSFSSLLAGIKSGGQKRDCAHVCHPAAQPAQGRAVALLRSGSEVIACSQPLSHSHLPAPALPDSLWLPSK